MSIFPATDLVINVDHAADPAKRAFALQRLKLLSSPIAGKRIHDNSNTHSINFTNSYHPTPLSASSPQAGNNLIHRDGVNEASSLRKFEAFLLQSWLEIILPKVEGGAYGSDSAAGTWRSLFAEQLGEQLAQKDFIGISRVIKHDVSETIKS